MLLGYVGHKMYVVRVYVILGGGYIEWSDDKFVTVSSRWFDYEYDMMQYLGERISTQGMKYLRRMLKEKR